jgi:hypothetical protein
VAEFLVLLVFTGLFCGGLAVAGLVAHALANFTEKEN